MTLAPVDLSTCDREPIHVPGAIQSFGALLVLDAHGRLQQQSANAGALLGALPALGEPFPAPYRDVFTPWLAALAKSEDALEPVELELGGRTFDVVAHASGGQLVVELEPRSADAPALSAFAVRAQRALERVQRQRTVDSVLAVATEELWALTGFDRVMAYRFLHDDSGHVVAERKQPQLETFLGLRYPATDIPVQARRLFALNPLRFIPDLAYRSIPIEPPCGPDSRQPLDLSNSMLRSVSPVHVEYLQNMDVTASMSISLVVGGRLWGLFACHHYSGARLVPHAARMSCVLLAQVVAALVERCEIAERAQVMARAATLRDQLSERLRAADDVVAALVEHPSFVELVAADGGAVLWDKRVVLAGRTPSPAVMPALAAWLRARTENVVHTHALPESAPPLAAQLDGIAGLLAVRVQPEQDAWLIWFRREEAETVRWAGNPEKTYSEGPLGPRLNPRGSFREWRETVRGRAAPFREHEIDIASSFRRDVQEVALTKLSELERARDLMLAALGHDLRTPLSAITMAATLLGGESHRSADLGKRIARSSGRMQRLIDQMLDLSRIQSGLGLGVDLQSGDLSAVVRQAVDEARTGFPGSELQVSMPEQVLARIDADRMGQVVSNLLSNARHHGKLGSAIRLELAVDARGVVLTVTNEGGPIPAGTRAQLFQPFKLESLEHPSNRTGLGLGLHIVHEIVRSHAGMIEVDDVGGFVTFRVVLPAAG